MSRGWAARIASRCETASSNSPRVHASSASRWRRSRSVAPRSATERRPASRLARALAASAGTQNSMKKQPFTQCASAILGILGQGALQAVSGVEPEPQVLCQRRIEIVDRRFARGGGLESACIQHSHLRRFEPGCYSVARQCHGHPCMTHRSIPIRLPPPPGRPDVARCRREHFRVRHATVDARARG